MYATYLLWRLNKIATILLLLVSLLFMEYNTFRKWKFAKEAKLSQVRKEKRMQVLKNL